jgi:hypothetical protein
MNINAYWGYTGWAYAFSEGKKYLLENIYLIKQNRVITDI